LIEEHYAVFADHLPSALHDELDALAKRLAE
jgi:GTP-dependent phosphoenolpyruvate carboxykinase